MIDTEKPYQKLSFISSEMRVRYEVNKAFTMLYKDPPQEILDNVVKKLQSEKEQGRIKFIRIFNTRIFKIWKALRESSDPNDSVAVTLGAGAPDFPNVQIREYHGKSKIAFHLTIEAKQKEVETWDPMQLKLYIGHILRSREINQVPNAAHIHSLWLRAASGQKIIDYPVRSLPDFPIDHERSRPTFLIIQTDDSMDLGIALFDAKNAGSIGFCEAVINALKNKVSDLEQKHGVIYKIFVDHVISKLHSAYRGPEHLGIDLPFMIHAASGSDHASNANCEKAFGKGSVSKNVRNNEKFTFNPLVLEISEDSLVAKIKSFDTSHYYQLTKSININWIVQDLKRKGIVFGLTEDLYSHVDRLIKARKSLANVTVAAGEKAKCGENPHIKLVTIRSESGLLHKSYASEGECIAEISYDEPPKYGTNIYGNSVTPAEEELAYTYDKENIELREGKFYAKSDGIPQLEDKTLILSKALRFEEGVESTEDDIFYDGDIHVVGDISFQKVIHCTGNLHVEGSINGGRIFCKGNITVSNGIIGKNISIYCGSDVSADFVDNVNRIICKKLLAERQISHCTVFAEHEIKVESEEGNLFGGVYTSQGDIFSANIGRDNAKTRIFAGYDVKNKLKRAMLEGRKSRLFKEFEKVKSARSSAKSRPRKDKELIQKLDDRLDRIEIIIDKIEIVLKNVQKRTANPKARVKIPKILSKEVKIWVAEKEISRQTDLEGAVLVGSSPTNRHILSFNEAG